MLHLHARVLLCMRLRGGQRRGGNIAFQLLAPEFVQLLGGQLNVLRQFGQQLALEGAIGQQGPQRARLAGQAGTAFGGAQIAVRAGGFDQKA